MPGLIIPIWFEATNDARSIDPETRGVAYELLCAELCGWGHYKMKARIVAQPMDMYRASLQKLQREQWDDGTTGAPPAAVAGKE